MPEGFFFFFLFFFFESILLMFRVNIPCVANTVISRTVHTANHVFHVFACRKGERDIRGDRVRDSAKLRGQ